MNCAIWCSRKWFVLIVFCLKRKMNFRYGNRLMPDTTIVRTVLINSSMAKPGDLISTNVDLAVIIVAVIVSVVAAVSVTVLLARKRGNKLIPDRSLSVLLQQIPAKVRYTTECSTFRRFQELKSKWEFHLKVNVEQSSSTVRFRVRSARFRP